MKLSGWLMNVQRCARQAALIMTELNRKTLWRWLGRFSLANGLVLLLIGIRFLAHYGWPDGPLATTYLLAASFGHYALLAALPLLTAPCPSYNQERRCHLLKPHDQAQSLIATIQNYQSQYLPGNQDIPIPPLGQPPQPRELNPYLHLATYHQPLRQQQGHLQH